MKKLLIVVLAVFILLSIVVINEAATPSDKLARGIANVAVGGICEIPKNIDAE